MPRIDKTPSPRYITITQHIHLTAPLINSPEIIGTSMLKGQRMNLKLQFLAALCILLPSYAYSTPQEKKTQNAIADIAIRETLIPIRPGGVNNRPFWNTYAKQFMYVPSFEFAKAEQAHSYRFEAEDRFSIIHSFCADSPTAPLTPIWKAIPTGPVYLTVHALDKNGKKISTVGTRVFYRSAPFRNGYPPADRSYADAAKMTYNYLFNLKVIQQLADGDPDLNFALYCYPSKMYSSIITGMVNYAEMVPEKKERALAIACGAADYLIKKSVPEGQKLEYLPQTYEGNKRTAKKYGGTIMMIYPASVGSAMIKLHKATGNIKYIDYAIKIGDQYLKLQLENGSWHLILNIADGKPRKDNYCIPTPIMDFLEQLSDATGNSRYRAAAQKGMSHLQRTLESFNWEGQFEDIEAQVIPYHNLTLHSAVSMFLYLCRGSCVSPERLRQAREVLRFAEDQFIVWEQAGWAGSSTTNKWRTKEELQIKKWNWFRAYHVPCGLEQYRCYVPVDSASAKIARFFLLMYKLEKNPVDLAKARALCDSLTRLQEKNGRIPTWAQNERNTANTNLDWFNCMFYSADTLKMLSELSGCNRN